MGKENYPEKIYVASVYEDGRKGSYTNKLGDWDCFNVEYTRSDLTPTWHKYPDEKPTKIKHYLVTYKFSDTIDKSVSSAFFGSDGTFGIYDSKVIAWQELSEPF